MNSFIFKNLIVMCCLFVFCASPVNAFERKKVKIGIAANMSEVSLVDCNPFGTSFQQGIYLAMKSNRDILDKIPIELEIVPFDYGMKSENVIKSAIAAVNSDVVAVVGYTCSTHALLAAPIHKKSKLPMITPSATADRLSTMGRYIHSGCFTNTFMAHTLAKIAHDELGANRVLTVVASDCAYCQDLGQAFSEAYRNYEGTKNIEYQIMQTDDSFPELVQFVLKEKPDIVFLPNQEILSAKIIKEILNAKINVQFLGADGWGNAGQKFYEMLKGYDLKGYAVAHWHTSLKDSKSQNFIKKYKEKYGRLPNDTSVLAYDTMSMFIHALMRADQYDREGVEEALNRMKSYEGVTGKFVYTNGGYANKSLVLLRLQDQRFEVVKRVDP